MDTLQEFIVNRGSKLKLLKLQCRGGKRELGVNAPIGKHWHRWQHRHYALLIMCELPWWTVAWRRGFKSRLTVPAVDPVEARLAFADVLAEHVPSPGVAPHSTHAIVGAGVGAAGS